MRSCTRCGELLPIDEFYFVSTRLGTRRGQCKACMREIKALQRDPNWLPTCSQCGRERERAGPGRRLCFECFATKYDAEPPRKRGAHYLKLNPCSVCGAVRLRDDHVRNTSLCPICRSVPQSRRKSLKAYNLTPPEFVALVEEQRYRCWICERKPKSLHVDHSHASPRLLRGLVCNTCNTILGLARDNADILDRAAQYLREPPLQIAHPGRTATEDANRRHQEYRPVTRRRA